VKKGLISDFNRHYMRYSLFLGIALSLNFSTLFAQDEFYRQELLNLADLSRLPLYRTGEIEQLSSYDRTGGNDDGFSGKYSAIRKDPDGLVIADLKGPGVVNRIWTPTPTTDTVKFYFDGEKKPRIAIPFINLFTGKESPFLAPLCGNQIGGFYCYLPIPYEKSLKIVYAGKNLRFHQIEYRTFSQNEKVKTFSKAMVSNYKDENEQIAASWNREQSPLKSYGTTLKTKKLNLQLRTGVEENIFSLNKGGRIIGIEIGAGSDLVHAYRKVMLTGCWDNESKNAFELPLHDFFGFAFGRASMQSMVLGSANRRLYSYLPMPFDKSAEIKLKYDKTNSSDPDEILISGTIYYLEEKRNENKEGKLYVQSRREYNIPSAVPHLIADIKGKGHYIGTTLIAQGLEDGHTGFFEGDDVTTIDGKMKLHGTGSEDYFNGGWYAVMDKWDRGMSLPIHGSLGYELMTSRTGGYRFYLSDKLNFSESIKLTIEHQPEAKTNVKTDYTSVAFFYAEKPQYENTEIRIDNKVTVVPHRDKLTAQAMTFSLYWLASANFQDPSIVFSLKKSDSWTTTVDLDAVSIAQVSLNALDNGRYKLFIEYGKTEFTNPFSIWQRSKKISEWISADTTMPSEGGKTVYAGEIEITDDLKTITLRKRPSDDVSVRVFSFLLERIEDTK
jgi:hypothetical protein